MKIQLPPTPTELGLVGMLKPRQLRPELNHLNNDHTLECSTRYIVPSYTLIKNWREAIRLASYRRFFSKRGKERSISTADQEAIKSNFFDQLDVDRQGFVSSKLLCEVLDSMECRPLPSSMPELIDFSECLMLIKPSWVSRLTRADERIKGLARRRRLLVVMIGGTLDEGLIQRAIKAQGETDRDKQAAEKLY